MNGDKTDPARNTSLGDGAVLANGTVRQGSIRDYDRPGLHPADAQRALSSQVRTLDGLQNVNSQTQGALTALLTNLRQLSGMLDYANQSLAGFRGDVMGEGEAPPPGEKIAMDRPSPPTIHCLHQTATELAWQAERLLQQVQSLQQLR